MACPYGCLRLVDGIHLDIDQHRLVGFRFIFRSVYKFVVASSVICLPKVTCIIGIE